MQKKRNVDRSSVSRAIKNDLKLKSYKLYKRHIFTKKKKAKRVKNGTKLLNNLKSKGGKTGVPF